MSIKEEGVGTRCNSGAPEGGSRAGGKDGGGVVCESLGDGGVGRGVRRRVQPVGINK